MKKMKIVLTALLMVLTIAGISAKNAHATGEVWSWGAACWCYPPPHVPVQVLSLTGITAVAAGGAHSLALKNDGTVWAWGWNNWGQLGDGTTVDPSSPVQVLGLTGITAVAAGNGHSLALKSDGTVWAWGENGYGQVGDGTTVDKSTPVQVLGLTGITAVATGYGHSLAVKNDGTVWGWGWGVAVDDRHYETTPVQISGLTGITAVAGGDGRSLALKNDGTVWEWGWGWILGSYGTGWGNGAIITRQVSNLTGIIAIAAGWLHSLALKNDGTVWAWGWNHWGQLGDGTMGEYYKPTPVQVLGLTGITAVAGGAVHSLALKNDGTVWAWGWGWTSGWYGAAWGDGGITPNQVSNLTGITAIAGGVIHSLAVEHGVAIDTIPPVITINSPAAKDYLISDILTIDFAVTDSQSGVKSFSASLDGQTVQSGQSINLYTLALGSHTLTVNAEDNAGNSGAKSVTFNIIVTQSSLINLIQYFLSQGLIANQGIANSMIQKIQNGAIGAFLNFLNAQDGKQIDGAAAAILRTAAGALQ